MTDAQREIALATSGDVNGILDLQERNLSNRGGALSVELPRALLNFMKRSLP
jgi:hypothetical protein